MRRRWRILGAAGIPLALAACIVGPWERFHRVPRRSETLVVNSRPGLDPRVELSFSYGELEILGPGSAGLVEAEWSADVEELFPELTELEQGNEHWVRLATGTHSLGFNLWDMDDIENHWRVHLGRDRPLDLAVNFGGGSLRAQLGGIPLRAATLHVAACEANVRFDRPNPSTLDLLDLSAAACEAEFHGLGNARFRHLHADLGSGSFVLDFHGEWNGTADATVSCSMGDVTLRLPEELSACVVDRASFTADVETSLELLEGRYVTEGYDENNVQLVVHVDSSMGSVEIQQD